MRHGVGVMICVLALGLSGAPARAADPGPVHKRGDDYDRIGWEVCTSPRTLSRIAERFAWAERNTWHRGFVIAALEKPRLRYDVIHGQTIITHSHCRAEALMTNGRRYTVYYIVEKGMGFASIGSGVDFCVLGLDPWRVYGGSCRTLR